MKYSWAFLFLMGRKMKIGIIAKNGDICEVFGSVKEAATELNVSKSAISKAVHQGIRVKGLNLTILEEKTK